jgi:hypothetical protein
VVLLDSLLEPAVFLQGPGIEQMALLGLIVRPAAAEIIERCLGILEPAEAEQSLGPTQREPGIIADRLREDRVILNLGLGELPQRKALPRQRVTICDRICDIDLAL